MTTQISSKVLSALGATLQEDTWNTPANNVLDNASADRIDYNGNTYTFNATDFYSDDALETKLESIFGGNIDIVSDAGSGWGSSGSTFKYLLFKTTGSSGGWGSGGSAKTVLIDANGATVTTSAPTTPKKPSSGSSSDNY